MFGYNFVAVFAFSASRVSLQLLFLYILVDSVTVMHSDRFHIDFFILGQDESSSIDVPPISTLIFDEIAHKFSEGYLQIALYEFSNIPDIADGLLQIFLAVAFDCVESFGHFGVYYEFAYFVYFLIWCVGVVWTEHPSLAFSVGTPAGPHNWCFYAVAFYESLDHAHLVSMAEDRW